MKIELTDQEISLIMYALNEVPIPRRVTTPVIASISEQISKYKGDGANVQHGRDASNPRAS